MVDADLPTGDEPEGEPLVDYEADNAASPTQYRKRQERSKRGKDEAAEFWKKVLADPAGRREIWRLIAEAGTFEERFACGPNGFPQTEATWFNAGQQAFGQRLYQSLIVIDRSGTFQMQDEHDPRFAKPKPIRRARSED